ncbi:VOC family protein [Yoonia litorea]|uniref:Glyoxalase-like domain-containing protein n=1 Tax=Yoonia litorea TaxID=1123755 RepID=A0A1I6L557_9RHOB|nr:VOC family protein [Yoonia litorea]SFR98564.1 Glyoxalase-like domain-containing protein [Yoonia litorea]
MLSLDHLTVIAPTLTEGVKHVRECLGIEVPFGTRHYYMGTHNHRLQLGENVYLEIVALDPGGVDPGRARWFGVDDPKQIRYDWQQGRRLRGWVAAIDGIEDFVHQHPVFGEVVPLPFSEPEFAFAIPTNGSLPSGGILPSLIDHRGDPTRMSDIPDLGARLISFRLQHPEPEKIQSIYDALKIDRPPAIQTGTVLRYVVEIQTPSGLHTLW